MAITVPAPPIKDKIVTDKGYMSSSLQGWLVALYKALGSSTTTGTAPAGATYITQSSNADLTAEQSLGALTTGLIKNTVSGGTGTLSTATAGTDYYDSTSLTVNDNIFTLRDNTDTTRQGVFQLSGITTGNTRIVNWPDSNSVIPIASQQLTFNGFTAARTYIFPDANATVYATGGTDVAVTDGGTGASTAADARTNLGLGSIATLTGASGTYTPTLTNGANVAASTAYTTQYLRIGSTVTVSGKINVDPTAGATQTRVGISLPISSDFAAVEQLGGTAVGTEVAGEAAAIVADITNNRAEMVWITSDTSDHSMFFTFTYLIV